MTRLLRAALAAVALLCLAPSWAMAASVKPQVNYSGIPQPIKAGDALANGSGAPYVDSLSGDCTLSALNITCLKTGGVAFGYFATGTDAANLTGTVSVNRFNSGTSASSSTFLRGDGTWQVIGAGSGINNPFCFTGANPACFAAGAGAPSASPLGAGTLFLRSDIPLPYVLLTSSAAVPAVVQAAAHGGGSVTMSATPAAGDWLVGFCSDHPGTPAQASGWTLVSADNAHVNDPSRTVVRKLATATESTTETPCTGSGASIVWEVSGVTDWTAQFQGQVTGFDSSGGTSLNLTTTTSSANTLVLGGWGARGGVAGGSVTGLTQAASNASGTDGGGAATVIGVAGAAGQFPTASSGVNATGTIPSGSGVTGTLILITPGASSWAQVSYLATIQNAGSTISTLPYILNCSTGVSCAASTDANGLDKITLTATGPTGSGATGAIAKWSSSSNLISGDLSGDCTTSGSLAVTCTKTSGTAFGTFATGTDAANLTGTVSVNRFNSGTGASTTTFLRGDGTWVAPAGSGTVTSVTCGTGLSGGTFTTTGACSLPNSGVTAASYGDSTHSAQIAVDAQGRITAASSVAISGAGGGATTIVHPGGRLTLVSGSPVPASDQVAKATLYYDCAPAQGGGKYVPYYDGSTDQLDTVPSCEVSDAMQASGTGVLNPGDVFDVYWDPVNHNICAVTNGSGAGWSGDTGGSTTARGSGYSALPHLTRGYYTNPNSLTHCYNGATDEGAIAADRATYLGTLHASAAGQVTWTCHPAGAAGGGAVELGLWNAYNRLPARCRAKDTTTGFAVSSGTPGPLDASTANRVTYVDGLGQSSVDATVTIEIRTPSSAVDGCVGVVRDATTGTPDAYTCAQSSNLRTGHAPRDNFSPSLGLHFIQAMQWLQFGAPTSANYNDDGGQSTSVNVEMGLWLAPANDNAPWSLPAGFVLLPALIRRRGRRAA